MQIHVVQRGENLWLISKRYGVHINRIIAVNELEDPNHLVIGLALLIPEPYPEYVVRSGDTLRTIADRYVISVEAIARANSISDVEQLTPGQVLVIPVLYHTVRPGSPYGRLLTATVFLCRLFHKPMGLRILTLFIQVKP